jgi:hypothetical protein
VRHHREISTGLRLLVTDSRADVDIPVEKIQAMQEIYINKHPNLYSAEEIGKLGYYLKAVSYKFHLSNLSLELLWALSDTKRGELFQAVENSLDKLEVSDNELLSISFGLEGFLLQARTLLDFYMIYLCMFLKTGHQGSMSTKTFLKELKKVDQEPLSKKAEMIENYFETRVFGEPNWDELHPNDWGALLVSLRDKVAHRDRLRPSYDSNETLVGGVLFDWPTLRKMTYERFCQYMANGIFSMFKNVSSILYDLEWKSGRYQSGIWK